eukprot:1454028-Rhodomonas_salina.1
MRDWTGRARRGLPLRWIGSVVEKSEVGGETGRRGGREDHVKERTRRARRSGEGACRAAGR